MLSTTQVAVMKLSTASIINNTVAADHPAMANAEGKAFNRIFITQTKFNSSTLYQSSSSNNQIENVNCASSAGETLSGLETFPRHPLSH